VIGFISEIIFSDLLWNIKCGIRALSSTKERNKILVLLADFFKGKKGLTDFRLNYDFF
jgi:hypothetical protein